MHSLEDSQRDSNSVLRASSGLDRGFIPVQNGGGARLSTGASCPASLRVRHGERFYLRCLKYLRQSAPSIVSLIMRQVGQPLMLSCQVQGFVKVCVTVRDRQGGRKTAR